MKSSVFHAGLLLLLPFSFHVANAAQPQDPQAVTAPAASDKHEDSVRVAIKFSGGYGLDRRDMGRPVILIASALGVPADVFRSTYRNVTPAPRGQEPDPRQVGLNKEALLTGLSPYGVTNDRLDAVSDYYRYNPGRNEMWRHTPAAGYATVTKGVVTSITITNTGSGYTTAPAATLTGLPNATLTVKIQYSKELAENGSITAITVDKP